MPEVSSELVALLAYLLPGLLVAWIFYALTSHAKPNNTERVIQALIFSLIVQAFVALERKAALFLGRFWQWGVWDGEMEVVASTVSAVLVGLGITYLTNNDNVHALLRTLGLSSRTSAPSEWCTVFQQRDEFVVLELKDGKRISGWPEVWPDDPTKGHLFVTNAAWVHDGVVELAEASGILIDVQNVAHVEFLKGAIHDQQAAHA